MCMKTIPETDLQIQIAIKNNIIFNHRWVNSMLNYGGEAVLVFMMH